ncbi:hypothetical protein GCM10028825_49230 [Spirosoma agri]
MVALLLVARILIVIGMYYALRKGRKDWTLLLGAALFLLTFTGYSLDRNWFWAALQIVVLVVFLYRWVAYRKSN